MNLKPCPFCGKSMVSDDFAKGFIRCFDGLGAGRKIKREERIMSKNDVYTLLILLALAFCVFVLIPLHVYAIYKNCGWMGLFVHCVIVR